MGVAKYAYAYARIRARLSDALDVRDVRAMIDAAGWDEFISALMNTPYSRAVSASGGATADLKTLERELKRELVEQYLMILRSVTDKRLHRFFHEFFRRLEVKNLKAILRQKAHTAVTAGTGAAAESVEVLYPVESYFKRRMSVLLASESLDLIVEHLEEPYKRILSERMDEYRQVGEILILKHALDEEIFNSIIESSKRLCSDDRKIVRDLVNFEMDIANVMALLRCKQDGISSMDEIEKFLIPLSTSLPVEKLKDAALAEDVPSAIKSLPEGIVKKQLEQAIPYYEAEHSLLPIENAMRKMFYEYIKSIMRGYPLNIGTIVGFLYIKEIEINNICAIGVCKEHEIPAEEIMRIVVF